MNGSTDWKEDEKATKHSVIKEEIVEYAQYYNDIDYKGEENNTSDNLSAELTDIIGDTQGNKRIKTEPGTDVEDSSSHKSYNTLLNSVSHTNDTEQQDIAEHSSDTSQCTKSEVKKCSRCTFLYKTETSLKFHEHLHSGIKPPYECPVCEYKASNTAHFNQHILHHTRDKPHLCPHCTFCASCLGTIHRHIKSAHPRSLMRCDKCEYSVVSSSMLAKHKLKVHTKPSGRITTLKCKQCTFVYTNPDSLMHHLIVHTSNTPYQCQQCKYSTCSCNDFNRHIFTHNQDKPHHCQCCNVGFAQPNSLRRHIKTEHPNSPLICAKCDYIAFSTTMFNDHNDKAHPKRAFPLVSKCPECVSGLASQEGRTKTMFVYKNHDSLKMHLIVHTSDPPYLCEECGYNTPLATRYNKHILTHTHDKPYGCPYCECWYGNASSAKEHIKSVHPGSGQTP